MTKTASPSPKRFIISLFGVVGFSIFMVLARYLESDSSRFLFLIWNLALAAVAPLLAWWLVHRIRSSGWGAWQQLVLTFLWLVFLPNSFYIVTDFIHLGRTYEVAVLYDAVLIMAFAVSGMILGYTSIYIVHRELHKRLSTTISWSVISMLILLVSFAIYLGRYSRWNTWDILLRPAGLLFDVSDRIVNPLAHTQTYVTTLIFFGLISVVYFVVWEYGRLLEQAGKTKS